jgi:hypothetical protein
LRVKEEVAVELLVLLIFPVSWAAFPLESFAPAESEKVDDVEVEVRLAGVTHAGEVVLVKLLLGRLFGVGELDVGFGREFGELGTNVSGSVEFAVEVCVGEFGFEGGALVLVL